jgi:L-cysteine/cystine lyase
VALTTSTTDGVNTAPAGLGLRDGDEVVTTDVGHPGLIGPLRASGADLRVAAVRDRPAAEAADVILAALTPRTRLVALSHVAWTTGHVLPIERVKAEVDVPVLVDGAQSAGAIRVDAAPFDFYTVSGQKWLCGPDATGGLYVRDPEACRLVRPTYFSYVPHDPALRPREGAAKLDSGWLPTASLAGLVHAIETAPADRAERAAAAAARCRELLAARVDVVTEPGHGTLVSFRAPGDAAEVAARLYERGVVVRDLPGTGWVRVSCGWWTSDEDLERLLAGLPG